MKNKPTQRSQQPKELGKEVSHFQQHLPLNWWALLFLSILGIVLTWYWASMEALSVGLAHGSILATRIITWGMGGMIAFLVIAIISMLGLITYPRYKLIIYEQGFSYENKKTYTSLAWEEITGLQVDFQRVWWMFLPIKRRNITLHLFNGSTLTINHYLQNLDKVKAIIEKQVFPIIMDRMRAGYDQGAVLPFGPILLSKANGIKYQNKVIRWESVHTMSVDGGWLTIKFYAVGGALETVRCAIKEIINLSVMLSLTRESLKQDAD